MLMIGYFKFMIDLLTQLPITTQSNQPSVETQSPWGSMEVPRLAAIAVKLLH